MKDLELEIKKKELEIKIMIMKVQILKAKLAMISNVYFDENTKLLEHSNEANKRR